MRRISATIQPGFGIGQYAKAGAPTFPEEYFNNPVIMWNWIQPTNEATYDWSQVESALNAADGQGKKAVLRFVANFTNFLKAAPDWLFDVNGAQVWEGFDYRCPVAYDPIYQAAFEGFLAEAASVYDGDSRIYAIQLICGGRYGEWVNGDPGMPGYTHAKFAAAIQWHIETFAALFPGTQLACPCNGFSGGTYEQDLVNLACLDNGMWLQTYSARPTGLIVNLMNSVYNDTYILIEAESGGGEATLATGFEDKMNDMFALVVPDMVTLNDATYEDTPTRNALQTLVIDRLRVGGPGGAANLAPNPSFESDPSVDYFTVGTANFSWATDQTHSGSHSIKNVSTQPAGTLTRWLSRTTAIAAQPGVTYTVSARLKCAGVTDHATLAMNFWDASSTYLGTTYSSPDLTGNAGWVQRSVQATAPAGTAYVRVEFRLYGPGTLWTDGVVVTDGSG